MLDSAGTRSAAVVLILAAIAASTVAYGAQPTNPDGWVVASNEELVLAPGEYVGDRVEISGDVVATDPVEVRVEYGDRSTIYVVDGLADRPTIGETLRVYGTLEGDREVRSITGFATPQRGYVYAYGISFVAGLWVLVRLLRDWRVEGGTLGLAPREGPRSVRELVETVSDRVRSGAGTDPSRGDD